MAINTDILQYNTTEATNMTANYLKPNSFKFLVAKLPNVTYTCQSANLPAVQLGEARQNTPFVDVPHPGDKLVFGDFTIRFLINEDMSNYRELYNWLSGLGTPYSGDGWGRVLNQRGATDANAKAYSGVFSDATLMILDSNNNPTVSLEFKDVFPVSVEGLDFDITTAGMEYFVGIATFKYKLFEIKKL